MEFINIILATVFVNNILLTQFLGTNPAIASSNNVESAFSMGLATSIITAIVAIITKLINDNLLNVFDIGYLSILIYVLIVSIVIQIYNSILKCVTEKSFVSLQRFTPRVYANTLTLGIAFLVSNTKYNLFETLIYSIGISLGFTLILILIAAINEKYKYAAVERQFREKALTFISIGLIALAFYGFNGLAF